MPLSLTSALAFLPSTPSLPSLTIVVVTEPVSKSVIVMVWVPSPLSTTSPVMLPPLSPFSPVSPFAPVAPVSPFAPVSPLAPVAPSLPSLPFLPSLTIVVVTEPVSKSVIVIVWVPSSLSTTSPVMLPPFSPVSPFSPLAPVAPVAPVSPLAPVAPVSPFSPFSPAVELISMVVPLRLISMFLPALIFTVFDALTSAASLSLPSVILPFVPVTGDEFKCHETLFTISVTVLTLVKREP